VWMSAKRRSVRIFIDRLLMRSGWVLISIA
jgi:hypothetical protein